MRYQPTNEKLIIIDTEQYAGNFEREMVAYITARTGECGVGEEQREMAERELPDFARDWFEDHLMDTPDDHGCFRPASISATPGWTNNGYGEHTRLDPDEDPSWPAYLSVEMVFDEWPPLEVLEVIYERAVEFCAKYGTLVQHIKDDTRLTLTGIRHVDRVVEDRDWRKWEPA